MVQQLDFNADGRYPYNSLWIMKDQWMNMVTTILWYFIRNMATIQYIALFCSSGAA
jgi:hypothetical protein